MQSWYASDELLLRLLIFIILFFEDVSVLFQIGDCRDSFINIVLCLFAFPFFVGSRARFTVLVMQLYFNYSPLFLRQNPLKKIL